MQRRFVRVFHEVDARLREVVHCVLGADAEDQPVWDVSRCARDVGIWTNDALVEWGDLIQARQEMLTAAFGTVDVRVTIHLTKRLYVLADSLDDAVATVATEADELAAADRRMASRARAALLAS